MGFKEKRGIVKRGNNQKNNKNNDVAFDTAPDHEDDFDLSDPNLTVKKQLPKDIFPDLADGTKVDFSVGEEGHGVKIMDQDRSQIANGTKVDFSVGEEGHGVKIVNQDN